MATNINKSLLDRVIARHGQPHLTHGAHCKRQQQSTARHTLIDGLPDGSVATCQHKQQTVSTKQRISQDLHAEMVMFIVTLFLQGCPCSNKSLSEIFGREPNVVRCFVLAQTKLMPAALQSGIPRT